MKNIAIPILVGLIAVVMVLYLVAYQVRETESAFITRFGKPVRGITQPGLYFKWPTPIERVHTFDSRMRLLDADLGETATSEEIPIIVNTYVVWRVEDPLLFYKSVGTVQRAETMLLSQINDTQNRVIGQHAFDEFVNSDPNRILIDKIQADMLSDLQAQVSQEYGIAVKTLGIKRLKLSKDVTANVFERMKAERQTQTEATIAEGNATATAIRTDAEAKRKALLAAAEGRAKAIRGQGDAEAAKYYKMLEADRELAILLRNLEALRNTLSDRATIVIPADSEPFRLLKEMPEIKGE